MSQGSQQREGILELISEDRSMSLIIQDIQNLVSPS